MLRHLDLGHMNLGPEGIRHLVHQLMQLTCLEHLNLTKNELDGTAAEHLARCLPNLTCIQHLDIPGNPVAADGVAVLEPHIVTLPRLTPLNIDIHSMSEKLQVVLQELYLKMPALQKL